MNAIYDDSKRARPGDVNSTSHRRNMLRRKQVICFHLPDRPYFLCRPSTYCRCTSTILEQTYDFHDYKGMFHDITYLFEVHIYILSYSMYEYVLLVDLGPVYDLAPPRGDFQGYDFLNPHGSGHSLVKVCKVLLGL